MGKVETAHFYCNHVLSVCVSNNVFCVFPVCIGTCDSKSFELSRMLAFVSREGVFWQLQQILGGVWPVGCNISRSGQNMFFKHFFFIKTFCESFVVSRTRLKNN